MQGVGHENVGCHQQAGSSQARIQSCMTFIQVHHDEIIWYCVCKRQSNKEMIGVMQLLLLASLMHTRAMKYSQANR